MNATISGSPFGLKEPRGLMLARHGEVLLPVPVAGKGNPTGTGNVPWMPSIVGRYLMEQWERLGLTQASFARSVGENSGYVQQVKDGKKTLADDKLPRWIEVLGLTESEGDRLRDLVAISHMQESDQLRFLGILDRLEKVEREAQELRRLARRSK